MKRILIILTVGGFSFGLGWWTNDMYKFSLGETADRQRLDSLKKTNAPFLDSLKIVNTKTAKKKTIRDYIGQSVTWAPKHSDTTKYMCEIAIKEITALYWYHGQCEYDYFTYLTSDTTVEVIWSCRTDCILDMSFLEKSNGIKKYPKQGDIFAALTLTSDTTLKVKYCFPEWIKKVNLITKDSLFPITYYLKRYN